jgi:CBS domain-containing protein
MALKASTAQDIMTENVECVRLTDTLQAAAERLARSDVGALPICEDGNRIRGILTDRDIVVSGLAAGKDPQKTTVGEIATTRLVTVEPDTPIARVTELMATYQVRRVPVVEREELVGMVSQADIARNVPVAESGRMLNEISST